MFLLSIAIVTACVMPSLTPEEYGTLKGNVTVGPLTPVETPGEKPTPDPEVFTSRKLVVYGEDGVTRVSWVGIQPAGYYGTYSIALKPGSYVLDYKGSVAEHAAGLPKRFSIFAGQDTVIDVDIDTGIR